MPPPTPAPDPNDPTPTPTPTPDPNVPTPTPTPQPTMIVTTPQPNDPEATPEPELVQEMTATMDRYNQYTFTVSDLPQYDEYGNELEYYAVELDGTDAPTTEHGTFKLHYGHVDGIGARVVDGQHEMKNSDGYVEYAINELEVTQKIDVPVQKLLNGRFDLGEGGTGTYPPFLFALFDGDGNPIRYNSGETEQIEVTETVNGVTSCC